MQGITLQYFTVIRQVSIGETLNSFAESQRTAGRLFSGERWARSV